MAWLTWAFIVLIVLFVLGPGLYLANRKRR
jgi:hypothetical protein